MPGSITVARSAGECAELLAGLPGDLADPKGHATASVPAAALQRMRQALLEGSQALVLAMVDKVRMGMSLIEQIDPSSHVKISAERGPWLRWKRKVAWRMLLLRWANILGSRMVLRTPSTPCT